MIRYAKVDENGFITGVRDLSGKTEIENLIPISKDFDITHKKWDFETETWVEYIPDPIPETPSPTEDELQWQAITDLEISQMEYDQALTDLELAYLEGSAE